jgi:hypothetical protein
MAKWALYVDPATGGFVEDGGTWVRCGSGIMAAVNAVLTERGSVPALADFGAGPEPEHLTESSVRDFERHADAALRPLLGVDFDDYERVVGWDPAGNLTRTISVFRGTDEESETIPVE